MRQLTHTHNLNDLVGSYGPDWRTGVCADHEHMWMGRTGNLPTGKRILIRDDCSFEQVVCGEIIWIDTEDGRIDGRCGADVFDADWACPGHRRDDIDDEGDGWDSLRRAWGAEGIEAEQRAEREDSFR